MWKIYSTNVMRSSRTNGNLFPVVRAILESGLIYSLAIIIVLACLVAKEQRGLYVVTDAIPPLVVS